MGRADETTDNDDVQEDQEETDVSQAIIYAALLPCNQYE